MVSDMQREQVGSLVHKDLLDKALEVGMHGAPEIKHDEKMHYLGEFRERVIRLLTKEQVAEPGVYPEIVESLKDQRATKMIICGDINYRLVEKYRRLAARINKTCIVIHDPEMKGNTGLVVVSDDAVDIADIAVPDRKTRLATLGVPEAIAGAAGEKVCDMCYKKITEADPGEAINYSRLTLADCFWGEHCIACKEKHGDGSFSSN